MAEWSGGGTINIANGDIASAALYTPASSDVYGQWLIVRVNTDTSPVIGNVFVMGDGTDPEWMDFAWAGDGGSAGSTYQIIYYLSEAPYSPGEYEGGFSPNTSGPFGTGVFGNVVDQPWQPTPVACGVTFPLTVAPGGQVTITLDQGGEENGGVLWTVDLTTLEGVGSFDPAQVQISDATGGGQTSVQVVYTAPATPQTVHFVFQSDVSPGGSYLDFQYSPEALFVAAPANKHAAFLSFE